MPPEPQIFTQQRKLREGAKQRMALGLTVHLLTDLPLLSPQVCVLPCLPTKVNMSLCGFYLRRMGILRGREINENLLSTSSSLGMRTNIPPWAYRQVSRQFLQKTVLNCFKSVLPSGFSSTP